MQAEIIAIGSELLLGQIIDTNTSWIARRLAETGIELVQTGNVGDDLGRMEAALRAAIDRSSIVITTGGIGPTEDDLTREAIANVAGRPLTFQPELMVQIEEIFQKRGFKMAPNNRVQAFIPEGALPIRNPKGTAPGFIVDGKDWVTISLPGVPSEMYYLMDATVIPFLRQRFGLDRQVLRYRVLRACGLGESGIGLQIKDLMKNSKNPTVGTLASVGDIRIRIAARGETPEEVDGLIEGMEKEIRSRLGILIYGVDDETLQGNVARMMERKGLSLSVLETATGGVICQKLSGTGSPSFRQGEVIASDNAIRTFLGLSNEEIKGLQASPQDLADRFASTCCKTHGTDLALAVNAGLVEEQGKGEIKIAAFFSLATASGIEREEHVLGGERLVVRERASIIALDLVRKYLLKDARA
jgi:nicotinamide-nucleotide amidase